MRLDRKRKTQKTTEEQADSAASHMEPSTQLRDASTADLEVIRSLGKIAGLAQWSLKSYRQELEAIDSDIRLIELNSPIRSIVIGFYLLRHLNLESALLQLAVHPVHRRQGWGRKLIGDAVGSCHKYRSVACELEVRARNQGAIEFYRSVGFCREGLRVGYYRNPADDAVLMRLAF